MKKLTDISAAKEYVRTKADIYKIISEDIGDREWKREGNFWVTLSPFRNESKPSFKVSDIKFKDWGGEQHGGDVFNWLQLWHGLRFEESVVVAAERSGVDITQYVRAPTEEELKFARYKQINEAAAEWMHSLLRENTLIRDNYLSMSGFHWDMIAPYKVGYCPNKDSLCSHVANKIRITDDDIHALEFDRGDLFNDAVVYPIHNHSGEVCTFRTKQLNTGDAIYKGMRNEHPLHDSGILYGFHVAKKNFRVNGAKLVIVEGQRDAIALKAVAVMTSSINDKQISSLHEYRINKVILCYDNDETGWKKTDEVIHSPKKFGSVLVLIARPPDVDTDPHDLWKSGGDEAVYDMLSKAVVPIEHYINRNYNDPRLLSLTAKQQALADIKEYLCSVSGIDFETAVTYLAKTFDITKESILDYIAEAKADYSKLYNLSAEKVLIAACMRSSVSYNSAKAAGITKQAFTLSSYQKLFDACALSYERFAENYTPQNVLDFVMARYADPKLQTIVADAMDENYKYTEPAACEIVLDMWKRRVVSEQSIGLASVSKDLSRPFVEIVNEHRRKLIDVVSTSRPQARTPDQLADEFYTKLKIRSQAGGNQIVGYNYHTMRLLNLTLGGIQPGHMMVIAGDTGAGKSLFGMNMLKCLAVDGQVPCLWLGQEMQSVDNTDRLVSIMTKIDNSRIQSGAVTQREAEDLRKAKDYLALHSKYYAAKPRDGTIDEIIAIIDEYRFKYDIKVVFWDYIQLVLAAHHQNGLSREQIIGHASKMIKNRVTEDMGLAAVVLAQMNRDKDAKGTKGVGGSYQLSQDSDDYVEIVEKTKKEIAEDGALNGNRYIWVWKRRGGVSKVRLNAHLDACETSSTLELTECNTPAEQSAIYGKVTP